MGAICNTHGRNDKGAQDYNVKNSQEYRMGGPGIPNR